MVNMKLAFGSRVMADWIGRALDQMQELYTT